MSDRILEAACCIEWVAKKEPALWQVVEGGWSVRGLSSMIHGLAKISTRGTMATTKPPLREQWGQGGRRETCSVGSGNLSETFAESLDRGVDVSIAMGKGREPGFEGTGCQVNAPLEHGAVQFAETF